MVHSVMDSEPSNYFFSILGYVYSIIKDGLNKNSYNYIKFSFLGHFVKSSFSLSVSQEPDKYT